jgi:uncharacterized membrane protein
MTDLDILYVFKYGIYVLGIIALLLIIIAPFIIIFYGIKQVKVKFTKYRHEKKKKKEIEKIQNETYHSYISKLDTILESKKPKKKKHK